MDSNASERVSGLMGTRAVGERALTALVHPVWLFGLGVLVVNDHYLKGAGLLPGWLTGKLSDVVGLLCAPAVLALLWPTRRGAQVAGLAVAVGFSLLKTVPWVARAVEQVTRDTLFPWQVTIDPTDLLALPAVALGVWLSGRELPRWWRPGVVARVAVVPGALVAMAGTSPPTTVCDDCVATNEVFAARVLGNNTGETLLVRIRPLRDTVEVAESCRPSHAGSGTRSVFRDEHFGAVMPMMLPPEAVVDLGDGLHSARGVYLVEGAGLPAFIVDTRCAEFTTLPATTVDYEEGSAALIELVSSGSGVVVRQHPDVYPGPSLNAESDADPACAHEPLEGGSAWSEIPPTGHYVVVAATQLAGGCSTLTLKTETVDTEFSYCLPGVERVVAVGAEVELRAIRFGQGGEPLEGFELLVTVPGATSPSWRLRAAVGGGVPALGGDLEVNIEPLASCGAAYDECADLGRRAGVSVQAAGGEVVVVEPGSAGAVAAGVKLHVFRAGVFDLVDTAAACAPALGTAVDSAVVVTFDRDLSPVLGGGR